MLSLNVPKHSKPHLRLSLLVVMVLYLAHALPLYFYNVALPAILRQQGVDLRWIGMLSLLYIPWALKFLWAPLIDRYYWDKLGKRKTWLLFTQIGLVAGVLALAMVEFHYGLVVFVMVGLWISTLAATQDIAIDGYTVEHFNKNEYRLGSMAQSIGVALGSMLGGALTLWIYQYHGWHIALMVLAALTALTMIAVFYIQEQHPQKQAQPCSSPTENITLRPSLKRAFKRPEILSALMLIVCFRIVEAPAMAMLNPMLIDHQWSLSQIGVLMSVFAALVGLLAAITAALWLKKMPATRLLIWSGVARTVVYGLIGLAVMLSYFEIWPRLLGILVVLMIAIRYVAMTALYAHFMQSSSKQQAGTDFTILVCAELLVFFIGGALSGFMAKALGYGAFYIVLAFASTLSVLLSHFLIQRNISLYQGKT